jgi:hypothetical protein
MKTKLDKVPDEVYISKYSKEYFIEGEIVRTGTSVTTYFNGNSVIEPVYRRAGQTKMYKKFIRADSAEPVNKQMLDVLNNTELAKTRIAKLEEALRWYADSDNYCDDQPILNDFGKRAKEAL